MDIHAAIIDQRMSTVANEIRDQARAELNIVGDEIKLKSLAFVFLAVN
ncbi:MAG: hypothetical protein HQL86_01145 [Magnetococcales bacterium]|nr:hypothetical protein [Magnetococcales bacterium]